MIYDERLIIGYIWFESQNINKIPTVILSIIMQFKITYLTSIPCKDCNNKGNRIIVCHQCKFHGRHNTHTCN